MAYDPFYTITTSTAVVLLILVLAYFGVMTTYYTQDATFPPAALPCPDYWTANADGSCTAGAVNLGALSTGYKLVPKSQGTTCGQRTWANTNAVVWDGVSNYNQC